MLRTVLLSFLLLLPSGAFGVSLHHIEKRSSKDHHHHWNYEEDAGPNHWSQVFKHCSGYRQSPIDIVSSDVDLNEQLDEFEFLNYDTPLRNATIENNGHTIKIAPGPIDVPRVLSNGGFDDSYHFLQLHFHWGANSKKGSEHLIDGQRFPLEMHLVHKNKNYKTTEMALKREDGLAVLGVLFKLSDDDNPALAPIIDKLDEVKQEGGKAKMGELTLQSLMPKDLLSYYRYVGSLTTPPCNEVVIWTVFQDFVPISERQLQEFRKVQEEDENEPAEPLVDNYRPPQELKGRVVEVSRGRKQIAEMKNLPDCKTNPSDVEQQTVRKDIQLNVTKPDLKQLEVQFTLRLN